MLRPVATLVAVALLSWLLSHWQQVQGQREVTATDSQGIAWIRTVDGWEQNTVLQAHTEPAAPPSLHPLLVAGFFLSASLLALLAFPETCGTLRASTRRAAPGTPAKSRS